MNLQQAVSSATRKAAMAARLAEYEQAEQDRADTMDHWQSVAADLSAALSTVEAERDALAATAARTRLVADHWREAMLDIPGMAHPLCMVLAAIDGATDPVDCGMSGDAADLFGKVQP